VHISTLSSIFDREYYHMGSGEIWAISHHSLRNNIPVYKIKDCDGEVITQYTGIRVSIFTCLGGVWIPYRPVTPAVSPISRLGKRNVMLS
jgi:hypothetical protein